MNSQSPNVRTTRAQAASRGFTLVELMIAMLLGLIVIAGVSSVFLANLRSYKTNTALSDVQTNARIAFELMARDIRQAGLTGCNSKSGRVSNVLNNGPYGTATRDWWAQWSNASSNSVRGYDAGTDDPAVTSGAAEKNRVDATTDSLELVGATGQGFSVKTDSQTGAKITLNEGNTSLQKGDIIIVCDPDHSTVVQVTGYTAGTNDVLDYAAGAGTPGNCVTGLGYISSCTTSNKYTFGINSSVSKLGANDWYIGVNPVGGKSLYRMSLGSSGTTSAQEMVRNVTNMQITYHVAGKTSFASATDVTAAEWNTVDAVHIVYTLVSTDQRAGTNQQPLTRTFATTVALRNRT